MRARFTEVLPRGLSGQVPFFPGSGRPTAAFIDLEALSHNFSTAVRFAEGRKILAVVKAHAYGHGAVIVSRHLLNLGADMLGVALVEEGKELREAGIDAPILVMGAILPEQAEEVVTLRLTPVVYTKSVAQAVSAAALGRGTRAAVHVKVDTGMGRVGIEPENDIDFFDYLRGLQGITVQGLMTHFADADLRDKAFASRQLDRFETLCKALEAKGMTIPVRHAANSAALLDYRRALFTMVRPGIMLYGYDPIEGDGLSVGLRPVLSLVTRITYIKKVSAGVSISYGRTFTTTRESLIATIPIGYADGYSRSLSNCGEAIVRGVKAPIAGRVCMDMCMLDVTGVPDVREGDEAVLIGSRGTVSVSARDLAAKTGTIPYEVLCGISSRVPRIAA